MSVEEKFLRENIRDRQAVRVWLNRLNRILAEGSQGDQMSPGGLCRVRNLTRYQE